MQAMTLNEATQNLANVMDTVNKNHEPLLVTHERHKAVVIIGLDDFNAWREAAYLSCSKTNATDLLVAEKEENTEQQETLQIGHMSSQSLPPTTLEAFDAPSPYQGKPLTLEDMQTAIEEEAQRHL